MTIRNPNSHELMPLPRGAQFLQARATLAGGDLTQVSMDRISASERLLQTADCVGTLACCRNCELPVAPCPVAVSTRTTIIRKIFEQPEVLEGLPSERSVLIGAMDAWQQTYTIEHP